jgi:nucleotide-binding universal stress UspA family protein
MKLLLAIDQSRCSRVAVEAVKAQYKPADCEVLLFHALDLLSPFAGMTALDPAAIEHLVEGERRAAEAMLERAESELRGAGFRTSSRLEEGEARNLILQAAAEWHADRIVVGSHGRGGLERFMLGSVSLAIARHAPCSVEIIRASS